MHEFSMMGGVFEVIEQALSQQKVNSVLTIKLKVGKLTNADPDALRMAFQAYSENTLYEGAELIIEQVPVIGRCQNCNFEFLVDTTFFLCPNCKTNRIEVIQGEELLLESLEVV